MRPRTLGEILDDAGRLALADASVLLFFNSLFLIPAFLVLLLLLAEPAPSGIAQGVLPALAALLLPLTGLASGACQELFRRRTAEEPLFVWNCLSAALRRGLEDSTARGVLLCGTLPGPLLLLCVFLPETTPILRFFFFVFGLLLTFLVGLPLWAGGLAVHVLLSAGQGRSGGFLRDLRHDVVAVPGRKAVLILSRLALLLLLAVQLHLLMKALLWVAENLGGFDVALLDVELAFGGNAVYTTALFLLTWLLLTPFFEAGNFLLHSDIRTRREGLDLQYRVQRAFGSVAPSNKPAATVSALLLCIPFLLSGQAAQADAGRLEMVREVRQQIETIRGEVQKAEPYPGGQRWTARLQALAEQLAKAGGEARRVRWFERGLADFRDRQRGDALRILDDIVRRLALLEDALAMPQADAAKEQLRRTPDDIKSLLRKSEGRKVDRSRPQERVEEEKKEKRREEIREEPQGEGPQEGGGRGVRVRVPAGGSGGGLSSLGWLLLGGLILAVLVVGVYLYLTAPRSPRTPKAPAVTGKETPTPDDNVRQVLEESPQALWRQAETLADEERFREAVRLLYLAVLALLHRQRFIRFEPMRTNGEYVRQVRLAENAPDELVDPFQNLTNQFETAWYGERTCTSGDYRGCRALAEAMQQTIRNPAGGFNQE